MKKTRFSEEQMVKILREEGLADAGLPDEENRPRIGEPLQAVEFFDLRLADRAARGEVDILERGAQRKARRLNAITGFALLAIVRLGLQESIEELGISGFVTGRLGDRLIEHIEHA